MKGYWEKKHHFRKVANKNIPIFEWQERRKATNEDGFSIAGYDDLFKDMDDLMAFGAALMFPYLSKDLESGK